MLQFLSGAHEMSYDASDIIIFGGAGDLALRKLLPALYRIYSEDSFSVDHSSVILTCRSDEEAEGLKDEIKQNLKLNLTKIDQWMEHQEKFWIVL